MNFHISVSGEDVEQENAAIKKIAANLLRNGVKRVVMIVDDEQTEYTDEGTSVTTPRMGSLFTLNPLNSPLAVMLAKKR